MAAITWMSTSTDMRIPTMRSFLNGLVGGALAVACGLAGTPHFARGYDWPLVRGDAQGTGVASGKLPQDPQVLWEFKTKDDQAGFEGTPVIAEGKVYLGGFQGNIYAIDLETGEMVWTTKKGDGFVASAAYRDGRVYFGDFSTNIYCFDAKSGEEVWHRELDSQVINGGNFIGDEILLSTDSGSLLALDAKSGAEKWNYATGDQLRSTASLWKNIAMLGGCDSKLHKIDIEKGTAPEEGQPLMAPTLSTPNVVGDVAIVPTQPGVVFAIDLKSGKVLWNYEPDGSMNTDIRGSSATLAAIHQERLEGIVVVPSRNKRLVALDAGTGKTKWEAILRKRSDSSPVICDDRVWIGATDGRVYGFHLQSGEESWSYQLSGQILASPAISNNKMVIATEKGAVVCFGEK